MKSVLYVFVLVMVGCMATSNDREKSKEKREKSAPTVSIYEAACNTCQLDIDLRNLKLKIQLLYDNPKKTKLIQALKHKKDSLETLLNAILQADYNSHIDKARKICASSYPTRAVKDSLQRDTLLAQFYLWYNHASHPIADTSGGYTPPMENGYYLVKKKGVTHKMKPEEYKTYVQQGLIYTHRLNQLAYTKRKFFASKITGLKELEIDTLCIDMLGYSIRSNHIYKLQRTLYPTDTAYQRYQHILRLFTEN